MEFGDTLPSGISQGTPTSMVLRMPLLKHPHLVHPPGWAALHLTLFVLFSSKSPGQGRDYQKSLLFRAWEAGVGLGSQVQGGGIFATLPLLQLVSESSCERCSEETSWLLRCLSSPVLNLNLSPVLLVHIWRKLQNLLLVTVEGYRRTYPLQEAHLKVPDYFLTGRTSFSFQNPGPSSQICPPYSFCMLFSFIYFFYFISIFFSFF